MPAFDKIEHIIVVMLENRSFDHYLGALNDEPNRDDVEGLKGAKPNPKRNPATGQMEMVDPIPWDDRSHEIEDPPHDHVEVQGTANGGGQFNGGAMDGFVRTHQEWLETHHNLSAQDAFDQADAAMGFYTRQTLATLYSIADEFTVCDHWFSSFMGSTWPNRLFLQAGNPGRHLTTPGGNILSAISDFLKPKPPPVWGAWEIPNQFRPALDWRLYVSRQSPYVAMWPTRFAEAHKHRVRRRKHFRDDCRNDSLPQLALVEPPYGRGDDHPPRDPRGGQKFIFSTVQTLLDSPSWDTTAMILVWDEHGGFYDHVPPPLAAEAVPHHATCRRLGMRVPALVLSPYTRRHHVIHRVFDHTSILATLAERWKLELPSGRARAASSLWSTCFDFSAPPRAAGTITINEPDDPTPPRPNAPPTHLDTVLASTHRRRALRELDFDDSEDGEEGG